jgi:thiosulfate/3-mercaptopyruvate sulfurtransferase
MSFTTLISPAEVAAHLEDSAWAIVDCRFALADTAKGRRDYLAAHIPGAVYAHLDEDLSSPILPGKSGRHPLPTIDDFVAQLSAWGIDNGTQVVVYDDMSGVFAGRLWWMLRWLGHDAVALLDGDWRLWQTEGRPTRGGVETRTTRTFVPVVRPRLQATVDEIVAKIGNPALHLFDVRMPDRYRGENETIDPIAGHIPGAINAPYTMNLDADGRFLSAGELRERFETLLGDARPEKAIFYCGSGVSAVHDLIAMEVAGLGMGRLFIGSWSEWSADPSRPVATGETP